MIVGPSGYPRKSIGDNTICMIFPIYVPPQTICKKCRGSIKSIYWRDNFLFQICGCQNTKIAFLPTLQTFKKNSVNKEFMEW